jgi:GTP cyclohydrolase IA
MNMLHQQKLNSPDTIADLAHNILIHLGEDPDREGLLRTPDRFQKALTELTSGYELSLADVIGEGVFEAEGNGLVSVKDIEFFSLCEHHMLPFWGKVSIAYYPNHKIVGLSKLPRIVDMFAKRLQVQERLTKEIATALSDAINAHAVVVKIEAQHMCMMMRGVKKINSNTITEYSVNVEKLGDDQQKRIWKSVD